MRLLYLVFLAILIASCAQAKIKVESSETANGIIDNAYIRTTEIKIGGEDDQQVAKEPEIYITSPKSWEVINGTTIVVKLNISNFRLVAPDLYPKKEQGHVQVWVDGMEFRGSRTEFVFENESNGTHIIKAELMMSNNTVLPYSDTIKVIVNKT